jgi:hypothetical protein
VLVLSFISWTTPLFPASPAYAALERVPHKVVAVGRLELIIDHSAILVPALCLFRRSYEYCFVIIGQGPSWIGGFLIAAIDPEAQQP